MYRFLLLLSAAACLQPSFGQTYLWADTLQYPDDYGITAIVNDADENVYVASSQITIGTTILFTYYCGDIHLRKYDINGNEQWEKIFPGNGRIFDLALDAEGNLIASGGYIETLTIDGETFTTPMFVTGSFLMKLDTLGNVLWKNVSEPPVFSNLIYSITTDDANNIYAAGLLDDITAMLKKFNPDGDELYSEEMMAVRTASAIELDDEGNIYLAGSCPDYASFDDIDVPAAGTGTGYTNYLVKYDSDFNALDVLGTRYFTFDFMPSLAKNSTGVYWRCTEQSAVGFSQINKTIHYNFTDETVDTIRVVPESFGIFTQFMQSPDDTTLYILENIFLTNKILQINDEGETVDSLVYSGTSCEIELFTSDSYNIWPGGYVYDSLVLDTITLFAEAGDGLQPFIAKYGPPEIPVDTIITDSCYAYFEFTWVETEAHFENLSVGSDSSEIISWFWSFCDGGTSSDWDAIHLYALDDVVCACLTITDVMGCTDEYCFEEEVGLTDIKHSISIYPNPVHGNSYQINSSAEFELVGMYDLSGRSIPFSVSQADQHQFSISISNAAAGIYFVKLHFGDDVFTRKIIIE